MAGIREFFNSPAGKGTSIALVLVGFVAVGWSIYSNFTGDSVSSANSVNFIDASTGKPFSHTLIIGEHVPVAAPSGGNTGYPAEMCYWNKDGTIKKTPTLVLLNRYKGGQEPTFCPDCGRLVTALNPPAIPGSKPPPTEAEYKARASSRNREE